MLLRLALLFVLIPLVELALLFEIAAQTGAAFTLGLVIVTGVLGAWLARREGTACLRRVRAELARGQMPADSLVEGLMILLAGAVLLTPGVLTDILGFALLIPPIRRRIKRRLIDRFRTRLVVSVFPRREEGRAGSSDVFDVEHHPGEPPEPR